MMYLTSTLTALTNLISQIGFDILIFGISGPSDREKPISSAILGTSQR